MSEQYSCQDRKRSVSRAAFLMRRYRQTLTGWKLCTARLSLAWTQCRVRRKARGWQRLAV